MEITLTKKQAQDLVRFYELGRKAIAQYEGMDGDKGDLCRAVHQTILNVDIGLLKIEAEERNQTK